MNLTGGGAKSIDGGATWAFYGGSNSPLPIFELVAAGIPATSSSTNVIAGTDSGIYGTHLHKNGGVDWVTNGGLASRIVYALAVSRASSSTVYAGTDAGLYKSVDSGVSWTPVTNGVTASAFYALYFDSANPSTLYAGTDNGVLKSSDGGTSWSPMNVGLTNLIVNAIVRAPGLDGELYAATGGAGVFVFTNEPEPREPIEKTAHPGAPRHVDPRR